MGHCDLLPITAILILWKVPEVPSLRHPKSRSFDLSEMKKRDFHPVVGHRTPDRWRRKFPQHLSLFFVQDYIGADKLDDFTSSTLGGIDRIPFWDWLAKKYGKHQSLAFAMVFVSIITIACFMLEYGQVTPFYILFALKGFCFGAFAYLPRAMLADVVDLDTVKSGSARPASYFAILGFMTKCAASFGGLSLPILGLVGYQVARGATNGPTELLWLGILYAIVPTILFGLASIFA